MKSRSLSRCSDISILDLYRHVTTVLHLTVIIATINIPLDRNRDLFGYEYKLNQITNSLSMTLTQNLKCMDTHP